MVSYADIVVLLSFVGGLLAAIYKHIWILVVVLSILLIYWALIYSVESSQLNLYSYSK